MNIFDVLGGGGQPAPQGPEIPICSRKGCRAAATTQLLWNNPKIHTPERRKIWLACEDHTAWLEDYLRGRALWKETLPLAAAGAPGVPDTLGAPGALDPQSVHTQHLTPKDSA